MIQKIKRVVLIFSVLFISKATFAQLVIGAGPGLHILTSEGSDGYGPGIGFQIEAKYFVQDQIAVGFMFERNNFPMKDAPSTSDFKYTIMPITVSGEYYFSTNETSIFAGLALGLYNVTTKMTMPFFGTIKSSESYFGVGPSVGAKIALSDNFAIIPTIRENIYFSDGNTGSYLSVMVSAAYILDM